MVHRWESMEKLFWIQTLPTDGPLAWVDHAWPCMGVHWISVRVIWHLINNFIDGGALLEKIPTLLQQKTLIVGF